MLSLVTFRCFLGDGDRLHGVRLGVRLQTDSTRRTLSETPSNAATSYQRWLGLSWSIEENPSSCKETPLFENLGAAHRLTSK